MGVIPGAEIGVAARQLLERLDREEKVRCTQIDPSVVSDLAIDRLEDSGLINRRYLNEPYPDDEGEFFDSELTLTDAGRELVRSGEVPKFPDVQR